MNTTVRLTVLQPSMKNSGYQIEDINDVFLFYYMPDAVVVKEDSPHETLQDLVEDAKANPGRVTFGDSGTNTVIQLASEISSDMTDTTAARIPFKGSTPAMTAVTSYKTQGVKAGEQVRTLAVATEGHVVALPKAPALKELGFDRDGGVVVPADTPGDARQRPSDILQQVNATSEFQTQMTAAGYEVINVSFGDVADFIEERKAAYAPAISA